jgi:hypothetical protein
MVNGENTTSLSPVPELPRAVTQSLYEVMAAALTEATAALATILAALPRGSIDALLQALEKPCDARDGDATAEVAALLAAVLALSVREGLGPAALANVLERAGLGGDAVTVIVAAYEDVLRPELLERAVACGEEAWRDAPAYRALHWRIAEQASPAESAGPFQRASTCAPD